MLINSIFDRHCSCDLGLNYNIRLRPVKTINPGKKTGLNDEEAVGRISCTARSSCSKCPSGQRFLALSFQLFLNSLGILVYNIRERKTQFPVSCKPTPPKIQFLFQRFYSLTQFDGIESPGANQQVPSSFYTERKYCQTGNLFFFSW